MGHQRDGEASSIQAAASSAETSSDTTNPGSRDAIVEALDNLARNETISPVAGQLLTELGDALAASGNNPRAADGWIDLDLIKTFARPETFRNFDPVAEPGEFPSRRQITVLEVLQGVFIFVPLLVTWFCLQQAAYAYHRMLADPSVSAVVRAGNFLELWQTGFGGKLAGPLRFEWSALYTLCAIAALIVITIATAELRRREDRWRDAQDRAAETVSRQRELLREETSHKLLDALTRSQLVFNRERLGSPARFAEELSRSADGLSELLAKADATQRSTLDVAQRYDQTARELTVAIDELSRATSAMNTAAGEVRTAAEVLDTSGKELRADVTTQVMSAASRLETATVAAERELARQLAAGQETLEQLAGRLSATLADFAVRVHVATDSLADAGESPARATRAAGDAAAAHIGQAFHEAVLAWTAELRDAVLAGTTAMRESATAALVPVVTASTALTNAIRQAESTAEQRTEALRGNSSTLRGHAVALQAMAARLTEALSAGTEAIGAGTEALGAGTGAVTRQAAVVNTHTDVLREHARVFKEMTARLAEGLGAVDTAARARQEVLLVGQADALRGHAAAMRESAEKLALALERTQVMTTPPADPWVAGEASDEASDVPADVMVANGPDADSEE